MGGQLIFSTAGGLNDDRAEGDARPVELPAFFVIDRHQEPSMRTAFYHDAKDALSHIEQLSCKGPLVVINQWPTEPEELQVLLEEIAALAIDDSKTLTESHPLKNPKKVLGEDREIFADIDIEIRILGSTEVLGIEGSLARRPKLTELIVYLAMHPDGASTSAWSNALWPDRRVPPQTIANRLSEARHELGIAHDGLPRLRRHGDKHTVAEAGSDWSVFQEHAALDAGPLRWYQALELVRGRPFAGLQQGQWAVLEGFAGEIEEAIVDCALRLGEHGLASEEPDLATFAAQRALRASPWDERLHRLLMRSADATGNRGGIISILQHLAFVLEIDGDPLRGVHPETAELYTRLSGRMPKAESGS